MSDGPDVHFGLVTVVSQLFCVLCVRGITSNSSHYRSFRRRSLILIL